KAARLICEMYLRLERVGLAQNMQFDLPLSQAELADVLGLSSVHMNRIVQTLRTRFFLEWEGHTISIADWGALAEFSEFDPTYLGWGENLQPKN
ncbi:MAG: helix-turn-helix domain-containing protein, partial [Cytophagaceae bacterium]